MTEHQIKVENKTEEIQKNLHQLIDDAKERAGGDRIDYQDYVTVFLINKIAELEIKLELLDNSCVK
jgi:hypothetical protein